MKKFMSLVLIYLLAVSFVFGGGQSESTSNGADDGTTEVRVSWWGAIRVMKNIVRCLIIMKN